jgi:hypothetical protein
MAAERGNEIRARYAATQIGDGIPQTAIYDAILASVDSGKDSRRAIIVRARNANAAGVIVDVHDLFTGACVRRLAILGACGWNYSGRINVSFPFVTLVMGSISDIYKNQACYVVDLREADPARAVKMLWAKESYAMGCDDTISPKRFETADCLWN